jgi:hypothetical protein
VNRWQPGHFGVHAATTIQPSGEFVLINQIKLHAKHCLVVVGVAPSGASSRLEPAATYAQRSICVPLAYARLNLFPLQARRTTSLKPSLLIDNDVLIAAEYGAAQ